MLTVRNWFQLTLVCSKDVNMLWTSQPNLDLHLNNKSLQDTNCGFQKKEMVTDSDKIGRHFSQAKELMFHQELEEKSKKKS